MEHINHTTLTEPAQKQLVSYLESFGNTLSDDHRAALRGLLGLMTDMALGKYQGRYAAGLDTGLGKSSSILHWVAALQQLPGGHNVAVSVAAQRVESLCEMKRDLIALGVPEQSIGLVHTYKHWTGDRSDIPAGFASEPATETTPGHFADRPIMLVSHTRVRGSKNRFEKVQLFSHYNDQPRALMIFDESLLVAEARQLSLMQFGAALGALRGLLPPFGRNEMVQLVVPWLTEVEDFLKQALQQSTDGKGHQLMRLPELSPQMQGLLEGLCHLHGGLSEAVRGVVEPVVDTLLELVPYDLRLTHRNGGGIMTFEIVVPGELENILILDASYPIRQLMHEDSSIRDAERVMVKEGMHLSKPLAQLKDYSRVTWHVMQAPGGRSSMNKAFKDSARKPRVVTFDVAEVIQRVPEDESVLVFVYKHRGRKNPDFKAELLADLRKAGIDTDVTVEVPQPGGRVEVRRRINVATWGNETGANAWAHCQHVVMVGILQKDKKLIEALMAGQRNDLDTRLTAAEVHRAVDSESAHLAHQAASRSTMRHVDSGRARDAHVWVIHNRVEQLKQFIQQVQSAAKWVGWDGAYGKAAKSPGKAAGMAGKVRDYLLELPPEVTKVSTSQVKKDLGLTKVVTLTWQRARDAGLQELKYSWAMDGRSFVKVTGWDGDL